MVAMAGGWLYTRSGGCAIHRDVKRSGLPACIVTVEHVVWFGRACASNEQLPSSSASSFHTTMSAPACCSKEGGLESARLVETRACPIRMCAGCTSKSRCLIVSIRVVDRDVDPQERAGQGRDGPRSTQQTSTRPWPRSRLRRLGGPRIQCQSAVSSRRGSAPH